MFLIVLAACGTGGAGGGPDAGAGRPLDGGTSDRERVFTAVQWFATRATSCTLTDHQVSRTYDTVQLSVFIEDPQPAFDNWTLKFKLGAAAGPIDSYNFQVWARYAQNVTVTTTATSTKYRYATLTGRPESLTLTEDESGRWTLNTFSDNDEVSISCRD